jgi:hypothetical protein
MPETRDLKTGKQGRPVEEDKDTLENIRTSHGYPHAGSPAGVLVALVPVVARVLHDDENEEGRERERSASLIFCGLKRTTTSATICSVKKGVVPHAAE